MVFNFSDWIILKIHLEFLIKIKIKYRIKDIDTKV